MDQKRAKIGLILVALFLGGCSVVVVIGSGSVVVSDNEVETGVDEIARRSMPGL